MKEAAKMYITIDAIMYENNHILHHICLIGILLYALSAIQKCIAMTRKVRLYHKWMMKNKVHIKHQSPSWNTSVLNNYK